MRKNIKLSVSFIIIILSIFIGLTARAEDETTTNTEATACTMDAKVCPDGSFVGRVGPNCEFAKCPDQKPTAGVGAGSNGNVIGDHSGRGQVEVKVGPQIKAKMDESRAKRDELRAEVKNKIGEVKTNLTENKAEVKTMLQSIKANREEFKTEIEAKKEEAKTNFEALKTKLKADLVVIKDEKKKATAENIVDSITSLNNKLTEGLSDKIDQIENVLVSIDSRISKAEENNINVGTAKEQSVAAKTAIEKARTAISAQISKKYEVSVTSESTLKAEMKTLRDAFSKDIKAVNALVKSAHEAVKTVATTLAKIPKINEEVEISNDVEVNVTNNNQ